MSNKTSVVHSDPEILGGTPVFVGTRVPLRNLFDYLERGHSLDSSFLTSFHRFRESKRSRPWKISDVVAVSLAKLPAGNGFLRNVRSWFLLLRHLNLYADDQRVLWYCDSDVLA